MVDIRRGSGIACAATASGATVVVDTFRAFTTAAVLLASGVDTLYLVADVDAARDLAARVGGVLCGEDHGRRPPGFDLGNSPHEAATTPDLEGATVVLRSTAGTRSVVAALGAGADPVVAAGLVVATATADAVASAPEVTIVSSGLHGTGTAVEDDLTGDLIAAILTGGGDPAAVALAVRGTDRATELRTAPWAHPEDVDIATDVDRYGFAMRATRDAGGRIVLERTDDGRPTTG